ncbi:MAG: AAA family ATPase [Anaerolineae bacterium]
MANTSGQIIRVLLISAQEETRNELAIALEQRSRDYRLYWVSQAEIALARAQDLVPHIIIVDDELEGTTAVSLITSLAQRVPTAVLVALVSPHAVGKANQAVLAGARGFLVKPLQADELISTLRFVLSQGRTVASTTQSTDGKLGKIVAVCAPKGGTGRTTTVVNLGYWLGQLTKSPVVLIDADYAAPGLDVQLNLHSDRTIIDLLPRIARLDAELVNSVLETHVSGLKALLAPSPSLWDHTISLPHIQQILAQLQRMFGWVVIDLGLQLTEMGFAFLDSADHIVITVLPEMVGLRNATWMLEQLRSRGYPEDRVWLVINRSTLRGGISPADIEQHLHIHVKHAIPDDQHLATYAINRGVPFSLSHPKSALAKAERGLAQLLVQSNNASEDETVPENTTLKRKTRFAWPWAKRRQEVQE